MLKRGYAADFAALSRAANAVETAMGISAKSSGTRRRKGMIQSPQSFVVS